MKQLSFFDLTAGSKGDRDGPTFWWAIRFKPLYEQAVADFVKMYQTQPIFYLAWPKSQVFLTDPGQAVIIDRVTGGLTHRGRRALWKVDYGAAKAFRPQDLAPQIPAVLTGAESRETWRSMVMTEITVTESRVETLLARLAAEGLYALHWPASRDKYAFRIFGHPALLESLRYELVLSPAP